MRILLVTDIFPPDIGGPASFIERLAWALHAHGWQPTVFCCAAPAPEFDRSLPFRVVRVPRDAAFFKARLLAQFPFLWFSHTRIFVNGLEPVVGRIARFVPRQFVLKVVGDLVWEIARNHGRTTLSIDDFQGAELAPDLAAQRAVRDQTVRCAARVITPSRYLQHMVSRWGDQPDKVQCVLNGVSIGRHDPPHRQPEHQPLKLAFCGRLTNWKGVETLLLALQGVDGVEVEIAGDGPEHAILHNLTEQLGVADQVRFLGRVAVDRVAGWLAQRHVLVLPSSYEGLSHTLLEAGSLGLALIASDAGGNPEVVEHDQDGLLFPYGGVCELRSAVVRLRDDEALRRRLGQAAQQRIARDFDFERTVAESIEVIGACG